MLAILCTKFTGDGKGHLGLQNTAQHYHDNDKSNAIGPSCYQGDQTEDGHDNTPDLELAVNKGTLDWVKDHKGLVQVGKKVAPFKEGD